MPRKRGKIKLAEQKDAPRKWRSGFPLRRKLFAVLRGCPRRPERLLPQRIERVAQNEPVYGASPCRSHLISHRPRTSVAPSPAALAIFRLRSPNGVCDGTGSCVPWREFAHLLLGIALLLAGSVASAQAAPDCLPPAPPIPVTDAATLAEYRDEIGQEYSAYFDAAQLYLHCLDSARAAVTAEITRTIAEYQNLAPVPGE